MKNNIRTKNILPAVLAALGLACFCLSPVVQADEEHGEHGKHSIVGLWRVHYFSGGVEVFQSFDQWHSDGLEFEVSNIFGLSCQGTFKQRGNAVQLFHVGWNYPGFFRETQALTVSQDGNHYSGTWDVKNYDDNGKFLSEQTGTLRATRLTVH
jgi:hypothetical protein